MEINHFEKGFFTQISEYKVFEVHWDYWNPLNHIGYKKGIDLYLVGDHTPHLSIDLCFICVSLNVELYDIRHREVKSLENKREV